MKRLLVETYRPSTIDDYVFQSEANERKIRKWVKDKEIPNILLSGTPGTGKSTMSRVLVNELGIESMDVLYMNASLMRMEDIREKIIPFISRSSFSSFKIVQLEEADRLTFMQQKSLLQLIEDSSDKVRWILTCNYPKKIDPALHSRLQHIVMSEMNYDGILDYIINIIEKENIVVNDDQDLLSHIDAYAPDLRKIINSIDECTDEDNVLHGASNSSISSDVSEFEVIFKDGKAKDEISRLLELSEHIDQNNFEWFYQVMYENHENYADPAGAIIILSDYLDKAMRAANQRLHLDACLYHLFVMNEQEVVE